MRKRKCDAYRMQTEMNIVKSHRTTNPLKGE